MCVGSDAVFEDRSLTWPIHHHRRDAFWKTDAAVVPPREGVALRRARSTSAQPSGHEPGCRCRVGAWTHAKARMAELDVALRTTESADEKSREGGPLHLPCSGGYMGPRIVVTWNLAMKAATSLRKPSSPSRRKSLRRPCVSMLAAVRSDSAWTPRPAGEHPARQ